jgi:hypothetical protein
MVLTTHGHFHGMQFPAPSRTSFIYVSCATYDDLSSAHTGFAPPPPPPLGGWGRGGLNNSTPGILI